MYHLSTKYDKKNITFFQIKTNAIFILMFFKCINFDIFNPKLLYLFFLYYNIACKPQSSPYLGQCFL